MTTENTVLPEIKPLKKKLRKSSRSGEESGNQEAGKLRNRKEHKQKVVRDSFTMPLNEYRKIAEIKEICLKAGMAVKKSEILRAGLKLLSELSRPGLKRELAGLEKIKTGRPHKHK